MAEIDKFYSDDGGVPSYIPWDFYLEGDFGEAGAFEKLINARLTLERTLESEPQLFEVTRSGFVKRMLISPVAGDEGVVGSSGIESFIFNSLPAELKSGDKIDIKDYSVDFINNGIGYIHGQSSVETLPERDGLGYRRGFSGAPYINRTETEESQVIEVTVYRAGHYVPPDAHAEQDEATKARLMGGLAKRLEQFSLKDEIRFSSIEDQIIQ